MQLPEGSQNWADIARLGRYFLDLVEDPSWVQRRVTVIDFVDLQRARRSVSMTISGPELLRRARKHQISIANGIFIPLELMPKGLLVDFSIRDGNGAAIPLATSSRDSVAAQALILACAEKSGIDPIEFSSAAIDKVYDIAHAFPTDDIVQAVSSGINNDSLKKLWGIQTGQSSNALQVDTWDRAFGDPKFRQFMATFTLQFMPIVFVTSGSLDTDFILKTSITDSEPVLGQRSIKERLAIDGVLIQYTATNSGLAQREHIRLNAPEGTFATEPIVTQGLSDTEEASGTLRPSNSIHQMTTRSAATLYLNSESSDVYNLYLELRPTTRSFLIPSFISVASAMLILTLGVILHASDGRLNNIATATSGSTVALLLIIPSLVSAYFAQPGEHEVRASLLAVPRFVVGMSAFFTTMATVPIFVNMSGRVIALIWLTASIVGLLTLIYLIVVRHNINKAIREVDLISGLTVESQTFELED